jgi:hypothetical protein
MKKIFLATFAILGLASTGTAWADVVNLPDDEIFIQFTNIEQVDVSLQNSIDVPGTYGDAGNWGVVLISTIVTGAPTVPNQDIQGGGSPVFTNVTDGQISGIFYDIQLDSGTTATGGFLDLYYHPAVTIDADCMAGITCAPDASTVTLFTTGTLLAHIEFASGVNGLSGDCDTTIKSSLDLTGQITGQGQADSYGNILSGEWADDLNTDWFQTACGTRDIRFSNFFSLNPNWDGGDNVVGLRSNDPARTVSTSVPEPLTLGLLGLGLAGLGVRMRRRTN